MTDTTRSEALTPNVLAEKMKAEAKNLDAFREAANFGKFHVTARVADLMEDAAEALRSQSASGQAEPTEAQADAALEAFHGTPIWGHGCSQAYVLDQQESMLRALKAARMPAPVAEPGGVLSSPAAKRAGLEAAANTRWRDAVPKIPNGVHQLDAPAAIDPKGCVLFFDTEAECGAFMDWLAASPRATGETDNG
ncbi:MAG: hypothetical protein KG075_21890 [Alphaproteobacteria bacterium]|nr:hypothetical protein [Alphaproteobacteria bacterium]